MFLIISYNKRLPPLTSLCLPPAEEGADALQVWPKTIESSRGGGPVPGIRNTFPQ